MNGHAKTASQFTCDVAIIGGCGHVGLPLAIALADVGLKVAIFDINQQAVDSVNAGVMPFDEEGALAPLQAALKAQTLQASTDAQVVSDAETVIVVIGTPVDEHLNPDMHGVMHAVEEVGDYLVNGQLVVLRSTIYPGVTASVERMFERRGLSLDVVFCPERLAQGKAMTELYELPQIVSGRSERAIQRATALFSRLTDDIIELEPEEAELAKLFTNTWRYIKFATANQLYMMANDFGLDYERVRAAIRHNYPRASDLPGAGFAAGPCLLKDTMQLAAFNNNNFMIGHAAMLVNEGLPLYVVSQIERTHDLSQMTVGVLGMAFKGDSDDIRSSLSYKLRRILKFKAANVLCADPYVKVDKTLVDQAKVLQEADLIIIGTPHSDYANLPTTKPVIDIYGICNRGVKA